MKSVKRKVLFLLTLIPFLPASIAFAVDFGSQVAAPVVSAFDLEEEFARRLDRNLLSAKYYNFLEKENINSLEELNSPENKKNKKRMLKTFTKEFKDNWLAASQTSSIMPE